MVYGGNKSNYDWFKGQNNKDGKKIDRKKALKTTWKFSKIFIYFSLFFFSMWGCVQTFMINTSPYVGQGVEITNSRDGISPSVASMHIDSGTTNGQEVYWLGTPQQPDNVYLSTKDAGQADILNGVEAELKVQSNNPNFSLADANHGGNIVPRLVFKGKDLGYLQLDQNGEFVFSTTIVGTPVVASSDAKTNPASYSSEAEAKFQAIPKLNFYDRYTGNVATTDGTTPLPTINWKNETQNAPQAWIDFNKAVVAGIYHELTILTNASGTPIADAIQIASDQPIDKNIVNAHNQAVLAMYNWAGYSVNVFESTKGTVGNADGSVAATAGQYKLTDGSGKDGTAPKWVDNYVFGFGNGNQHTSYIPISTWGEAFDMSKGGGPFYGIFVYPIAWLTNELVDAMPFMQGWESFLSITIVILIMQMAAFLLSFKSTLEQAKMTELNAKKAVIEAKYAAYKGNKQMENRKKQEIAEMYKKEGVSQLGPMAGMLITMPIFLAMWRVVGSIQHFKGTEWLGMNFAASSTKELFQGEWQYLPLILFTIATQVLSTMFPRFLTKRRDKNRINVHQKAAMKKSNKTQNIMMIVFGFMAVMFNAGLQIYMVIRSLWKIGEVYLTHHIILYKKKKAREKGGSSSGNKFDFMKFFKKSPEEKKPKVENTQTLKQPSTPQKNNVSKVVG